VPTDPVGLAINESRKFLGLGRYSCLLGFAGPVVITNRSLRVRIIGVLTDSAGLGSTVNETSKFLGLKRNSCLLGFASIANTSLGFVDEERALEMCSRVVAVLNCA
jgi:hypothetical protein